MCQRLLNKKAIVTGAARGMGLAIARALYLEGTHVAIRLVKQFSHRHLLSAECAPRILLKG